MINNFPGGLCSDEVRDNVDSVQYDLCKMWNYTGSLNIGDEKFEKHIHHPGTVQAVQWKCLSRHDLIKA